MADEKRKAVVWARCKTCNGTGTVVAKTTIPIPVRNPTLNCPACGGSGKIPKTIAG